LRSTEVIRPFELMIAVRLFDDDQSADGGLELGRPEHHFFEFSLFSHNLSVWHHTSGDVRRAMQAWAEVSRNSPLE
jgi:hypothetical protein